ncbi:histidinol-phosphatase HisJ [Edaphobacillus lindanitolerans]|uniref:Histidinol-phosphatase n=1 Tax=Edaphobacillus lindanitolerans TaxID=550447 RepID=A0A1U7PJS0_9BACI|nr:histidinol-phosphatase HisJ [Edaphobacillus lindanitolerans]SIT71180.1 histidinol-phosphate phosphatase [Edaphobacillus lindanitolerans]
MATIDGHVHSPFCPHGTDAPMEDYVIEAERQGIEVLVFTEHAPLPEGFTDPVPEQDSAMQAEDVGKYVAEAARLRKKYAGRVDVRCGFEIDYIEGFERETLHFLRKYPEEVRNSLLSVHFVRLPDGWFCVDYGADELARKAEEPGLEMIYLAYGEAIRKAASKPFGELNPPVLGHVNLIHKFRKRIAPARDPIDWREVLATAAENGYRLDFNHAGLRKPDYGMTYPEEWMADEARRLGLGLQTGSDAHSPEDVGRGFAPLPEA